MASARRGHAKPPAMTARRRGRGRRPKGGKEPEPGATPRVRCGVGARRALKGRYIAGVSRPFRAWGEGGVAPGLRPGLGLLCPLGAGGTPDSSCRVSAAVGSAGIVPEGRSTQRQKARIVLEGRSTQRQKAKIVPEGRTTQRQKARIIPEGRTPQRQGTLLALSLCLSVFPLRPSASSAVKLSFSLCLSVFPLWALCLCGETAFALCSLLPPIAPRKPCTRAWCVVACGGGVRRGSQHKEPR